MKIGGFAGAAALAAVAAVLAADARAAEATFGADGSMRFGDGCELRPLEFLPGWFGATRKGGYELETPGRTSFRFEDAAAKFDVSVSADGREDGSVAVEYRFVAADDGETLSAGCCLSLPASAVDGREWRIGQRQGVFAPPADGIHLVRARAMSASLPLGGAGFSLAFDQPVDALIQDNRRWGMAGYSIRFGDLSQRKWTKGESFSVSFSLKPQDGALELKSPMPVTISAGDEWIPLDYSRDIAEGSALDFSRFAFADAPAGRHGWLRNAGGHFEFEGLPGRPQRFYGANLCFAACYPSHETADALAVRLRRLGYNSIRIHHHDGRAVKGSPDGATVQDAAMDRLDYLVAAAVREGLYVTTDLYVSRHVKWRQVGIDRDGEMPKDVYKTLCAVHPPAMEDWKRYAGSFLRHRNPYTGRTYAEETAMPFISLVNEGGSATGPEKSKVPEIVASWRGWLEEKRKADPSFAPGADADSLPDGWWSAAYDGVVAQWDADVEERMFAEMEAFVRSLGCRALLTDKNNGPHLGQLVRASSRYGYVDDHFYVDHPQFPAEKWRLPSVCPNVNPLLADSGTVAPARTAFNRVAGKPFAVTEWNFSGPGRYRGVGGILTGAMAALQDWDGMWRFAYSHVDANLASGAVASPGYFDLASDPLSQVADRAAILLFLRGDIAPLDGGVALSHPAHAPGPERPLRNAPGWCDEAWRVKVASTPESGVPAGYDCAVGRADVGDSLPAKAAERAAARKGALAFDRARGAFTIDTPRTSGGFAPSGAIDAGTLLAKIEKAPATVCAHSLDGKPVASSDRILVVHLTDVQGDGTRFSDDTMTTLLKWGGRPLVRDGSAKIALRLRDTSGMAVWSIATDGRRVERIPSHEKGGCLCFVASVSGAASARTMYEIVRER